MTQKILFFTAGQTPTAAELAQIAALNALTTPGYEVGVRFADASNNYGAGIESADFVAGDIPAAYSGVTDYGYPHADRPTALFVLPATAEVAAAGTQQLQVLAVDGADISALTISDETGNCTFASDDEGVATVDAAGEVTGVAAGTCTITATYTYDTDKEMTATCDITVPA